jgi:hypothetical protein
MVLRTHRAPRRDIMTRIERPKVVGRRATPAMGYREAALTVV